jgi:hypothetical protein
LFRLKPATVAAATRTGKLIVRRLHNQRPALPSSRQTFYEHVPLFQPKGFDHGVSSVADQIAKRHFQLTPHLSLPFASQSSR